MQCLSCTQVDFSSEKRSTSPSDEVILIYVLIINLNLLKYDLVTYSWELNKIILM